MHAPVGIASKENGLAGSPVGGGGGVARAQDAAALGDLLLEIVGVERVVRREEPPAAGVAREAEQPQQQLLREVPAVPVPRHAARHPLDPPLLLCRQRRRRAVVVVVHHHHRRRRCLHRAPRRRSIGRLLPAGRPVCIMRCDDERNGTGYLRDESSGFGSKWVRAPDLLAIYSPGRREERAEADRWFQSAPHAWIEIETA